jgi:hypothetical protein
MKVAERRGSPTTARRVLPQNPVTGTTTGKGLEGSSTANKALSQRAGHALQSFQAGEDHFHLNSLVGQIWLVQLREYTEAQYGLPAGAKNATLQTGFAWRSFSKLFGPLSAIDQVRLFENLLRFANFESFPPARAFFLAYAPLSFEHDVSGEYIGPGVWTPQEGCKSAALRVRRTLKRWCQWMEALAHFQVHDQRHAFSPHRYFDKLIILLWPLMIRHNWSYLDLLKLLRVLGKCGQSIACPSEAKLAEYCQNALRLAPPTRSTASPKISEAGQLVVERLVRFLPTMS